MNRELAPVLGTTEVKPILEPTYAPKTGQAIPPIATSSPVAIIVNHGMGQQVPYETIEGVAKAVWRKAGQIGSPPLICRVRLGTGGKDDVETELVRAEIQVQHGQQTVDVHIYESYWAPLTEGKVLLKDVMSFLFDAGKNGFWNTGAGIFQRWMFGKEQPFPFSRWKKFRLMMILLFLMVLLLALVYMNAVLAAAATSHAIGASRAFPGSFAVPLTSDFMVADLAAVLIVFGTAGLFLLRKLRHGARTAKWLSWLGLWILTVPGAALVVLSGWVMPFQLAGYHPECFLWPCVYNWALWLSSHGHDVWITLLWGLELLAAYKARWFLVEYVGDVTAYIAAHTVSKFYELRQQIWQTAMKVSRAVYRAQVNQPPPGSSNWSFLYDRVVMVGHSLGSVIGYDVLNGLLLEDAVSKDPLQIADRTRMFLTFGSPLDKTAFLFRTQKDMCSAVREVAAAAVQPMIQGYENRPKEWVNLYSKSDIISGALEFYDPPDRHDAKGKVEFRKPLASPEMLKPVRNCPDPDACTPLAAHVEYWTGALFAKELIEAVTTAEPRERECEDD
jgi:hypothetical protein